MLSHKRDPHVDRAQNDNRHRMLLREQNDTHRRADDQVVVLTQQRMARWT